MYKLHTIYKTINKLYGTYIALDILLLIQVLISSLFLELT